MSFPLLVLFLICIKLGLFQIWTSRRCNESVIVDTDLEADVLVYLVVVVKTECGLAAGDSCRGC